MYIQMMVLTSMTTLFAAGVVPNEVAHNGSNYIHGSKAGHRTLTAIRTDVSAALRNEAVTRRTGDNAPQVHRLIELYREMAAHRQRDTSLVLKELGLQVRTRLETVRDRIERRVAKSTSKVREKQRPTTLGGPENRVLAQQLAGGGAAVRGQGAMVTGIPRAQGLPADLGPELVELIQATISPDTWNINGGRGAIVYYPPLHVLVVSAPDEVHAQIGGVLGQLNAAQRQQDGAQVVSGVAGVQAGDAQQP